MLKTLRTAKQNGQHSDESMYVQIVTAGHKSLSVRTHSSIPSGVRSTKCRKKIEGMKNPSGNVMGGRRGRSFLAGR